MTGIKTFFSSVFPFKKEWEGGVLGGGRGHFVFKLLLQGTDN